MAHADSTVTISRPIGEVFAYLADGTNNPHWRAGVLKIERISPADGDQAAYRQVLRGPGGRRIDGDYRITEYHPPRVIGFEVTAGPLRPAGRFTLNVSKPGFPSTLTDLAYPSLLSLLLFHASVVALT